MQLPNLPWKPYYDWAKGLDKAPSGMVPDLVQELAKLQSMPIEIVPFGVTLEMEGVAREMQAGKLPSMDDLVSWPVVEMIINGTIDGMIYPLQQGLVEPPASELLSYSSPILTMSLTMAVKIVPTNSGLWRFVLPFDASMWLAIGVTAVVIALAIWYLEYMDDNYKDVNWDASKVAQILMHGMYQSVSALLGGDDLEWSTPSKKLAHIGVLIVVMIFSATYTVRSPPPCIPRTGSTRRASA